MLVLQGNQAIYLQYNFTLLTREIPTLVTIGLDINTQSPVVIHTYTFCSDQRAYCSVTPPPEVSSLKYSSESQAPLSFLEV